MIPYSRTKPIPNIRPDNEHEEDEHEEDEHAHEDHGNDRHHKAGEIDPHAWLDTRNASRWVQVMANRLAEIDPANAAIYQRNAVSAKSELEVLAQRISAQVAPVSERPFIVFHDAYQYFESQFKLTLAGTVSMSDAQKPGSRQNQENSNASQGTGYKLHFRRAAIRSGTDNGHCFQPGSSSRHH